MHRLDALHANGDEAVTGGDARRDVHARRMRRAHEQRGGLVRPFIHAQYRAVLTVGEQIEDEDFHGSACAVECGEYGKGVVRGSMPPAADRRHENPGQRANA